MHALLKLPSAGAVCPGGMLLVVLVVLLLAGPAAPSPCLVPPDPPRRLLLLLLPHSTLSRSLCLCSLTPQQALPPPAARDAPHPHPHPHTHTHTYTHAHFAMSSSKFSYKPLTLTPINFSLTEGTSIPAPLDSPPDTPRPPTPGRGPLSSHPTPKSPDSPPQRDSPQRDSPERDSPPPEKPLDDAPSPDVHTRPGRTSDAASSTISPASPTGKRPASVRKFLGIRTLSSSDSLKSDRPGSPATINSQAPSLNRRKSGSWFGKRKTFIAGPVPEGHVDPPAYAAARTVSQPQPAPPSRKSNDPPPPALPGLSSFGLSEDSLSLSADELFKNIGKNDDLYKSTSKPNGNSTHGKSTKWEL